MSVRPPVTPAVSGVRGADEPRTLYVFNSLYVRLGKTDLSTFRIWQIRNETRKFSRPSFYSP